MGETKILVADDELEVLELMAKRIEQEGYVVVKAHDGDQAWEKIRNESPDVIILDLMMPGLSGFEVLKRLRENPPSAKWQPVIIVSAKGEMDDMQKGFALEADHYITKPSQMEDILKGIKLMVSLIPQRIKETDDQS